MKRISTLVHAALALTLLAGAATAQTEPLEKDLAKVRSELAATQKALTEAKQALGKSQTEQAETQAKLAEITKTADALRKELETEKAHHRKAVAKLNAAIKEAAAKQEQTTRDDVRAKAELSATQKTLHKLQPDLPVTIVVTLPADAKLTFDGLATTSIGGRRTFVSPPIVVGFAYGYLIKADARLDGKMVTIQKHIVVHAGDRLEVSLAFPDMSSVVQR